MKYDFVCDTNTFALAKYHYAIQGWSTKELIVTNAKPAKYIDINMNDNRVPDVFHKIPGAETWLSRLQIDTTETYYANQHVRIGRVLYKIPDNIVKKEAYLAALHKATRRVEPKTHNLSFDQKVFLAALVSRDRKFLSKKDAKKIIKRLKLLFPDELKLIKDCADEITQKVKL